MPRPEPAWVADVVWWHVYPLGFTGADTTGADPLRGHRLTHLVAWLDYAVALGATGLALGPVFASSTHGYDTVDHLRIDPRLGDDADFDLLVEAARSRGLPLLLDGVFNHVGREHPAVQEVVTAGPDADRAPWFRIRWSADGVPDLDTFEGHDGLVALEHEHPAVVDHVVDVMRYWLDRGAAGWRLDAAYAVPAKFWRTVLERVRETHPQVYVVGEVIHGDYAGVVETTGFDAVTQYELWKAVRGALTDRNFFELAWALRRNNTFLATFAPMTFIGNHDVTRLASALPDDRLLAHAVLLLLTTGGSPSLYYGDEQGFRGVKEARAGGDDAVRPTFPAGPDDLAPDGRWLHDLHRELLALRRERPWLHRATAEIVHLANQHLLYDAVAGDRALRVALNLGDVTTTHATGRHRRVLLASPGVAAAGGAVRVPAGGWAVLEQ